MIEPLSCLSNFQSVADLINGARAVTYVAIPGWRIIYWKKCHCVAHGTTLHRFLARALYQSCVPLRTLIFFASLFNTPVWQRLDWAFDWFIGICIFFAFINDDDKKVNNIMPVHQDKNFRMYFRSLTPA